MQRLSALVLALLLLPPNAAAAFPEDFDPLDTEIPYMQFFNEGGQTFQFEFNVYQPHEVVTRAQFVATVVDRLYPEGMEACFLKLSPSRYSLLFADVLKDAPYGEQLCIAMRTGMIRGYPDATFRPDQPINFAEASKVLTKAFGLSEDVQTRPRAAWFQPYVDAMMRFGVLPNGINLGDAVTRADLTVMLSKLD